MAIVPSESSYQKIELTQNINLYLPFFTPTGELTITDIMDVEPDQDGWQITLPNATETQPGANFIINNIGVNSFSLMLNDGVSELINIAGGEVKFVNLTNNSNANGIWSVTPFGGGQAAVAALNATSSNGTINIVNGKIVPPGGDIDFTLGEFLTNFQSQSISDGFPVISDIQDFSFSVRTLNAGSNIIIDNQDGKAGNPTISLNNSIENLSSVQVGSLTLSGLTISTNENSNIFIQTTGTGNTVINGVTIDSNNNVSEINDLSINGNFSSPFIPSAWCVFTDTTTGSDNTIVNENSANVASITGSNGNYVIEFTNPMSSINYAVVITTGSNGSALPPPIYHAFFTVRNLNSVTIAVLDASGEFVQSMPDGVSVIVI